VGIANNASMVCRMKVERRQKPPGSLSRLDRRAAKKVVAAHPFVRNRTGPPALPK